MDLSKKLQSTDSLFADENLFPAENPTERELLTKYENAPTYIYKEAVDASAAVAKEIANLIREKQAQNKNCVLGLATGSTPLGVYKELVRLHQKEGLSFRNVISFNLDEYFPMEPSSNHSYHHFMHKNLFDHIDIRPENIYIPDGTIPLDQVHDFCVNYEERIKNAGGIDLQLLGIGRTGHIGFNEPGSRSNSRTRIIVLDTLTRRDASSSFNGIHNVPQRAITMGVGTIMEARKVILLAMNENKAAIIKKAVEGNVTPLLPASFLQNHSDARFILDSSAASDLIRVKTPWLVGSCDWNDERLVRKAVVWLCQKTAKPILKLTDKDYNDNGLSDLIVIFGSAYSLNIKVFNDLQSTITGWPGGKPNADDSRRPERAEPAQKRVVVFSPHPDDDVISMGGTLIRLADQGHDVHVAYQVSGNVAVSDEYATRFISFHNSFSNYIDSDNEKQKAMYDKLVAHLKEKEEGDIDLPELRKLKSLIRRMEAKAACRYSGIKSKNVHFLDLPFYETGKAQKSPISEKDVRIVMDFLTEIKPHQIFAAGDLSDPHGTHRVCLDAILIALEQLKDEDWMQECWIWLYRGAWAEWDIDQIEMAVPISPQELLKKREAIFRHQSQKEGAMFMGNDDREFWQRAEDRNHATACLYNKLGMAEYEAIEAFVRYYP